MHEPTHASFFSGAGGLDIGLERAGWRTVSFSEINPYASAVLAEQWPGVPNLGDITTVADRWGQRLVSESASGKRSGSASDDQQLVGWDAASRASLWTGGFPCQDLSVAGKRRGMGAGTRSGLAFSFLDLVGRHRPRFVLLENVPGLLSSHGGRDMGALTGRLEELGYVGAYRTLDARYFGVPQRRRRVFILGIHASVGAGAERAAEVLSVGSRCHRHPPTGIEAGPGAAIGARPGVDIARAVTGTSGKRHDDDTDTLIANGLRASDGHHGWSSPRGDGGDNLVAAALGGNPYGDHVARESHLVAGEPMTYNGVDATDQDSAAAIVRRVWSDAGEEAVQRAARGLRGLPAAEVLRLAVHGRELRQATGDDYAELEYGALALAEGDLAGTVPRVRGTGGDGRSPSEQGLAGQPAGEPDPSLSILSSARPLDAASLPRLREAAEGSRPLQQALAAAEEMGRPANGEAQRGASVRRLTPVECERLQGWPDGHTIVANWAGKGNPPVEPRYHRSGPGRAPDGLAGRSHDREGVADTLRVGGRASGAGDSYDNTPWIAETLNSGGNSGGFRTEPGAHLVTSYRKATKAHNDDDWERWEADDMTDAITASGLTPRTDMAAVGLGPTWYDTDPTLLPLGLDSHRYRCCGNGVVADVAEWIGRRLLEIA